MTCAQGHKFAPRYDKTPMSFDVRGGLGSCFTEIHYKHFYVHDICMTCGKTVTRSNDEASK